MKIFKIIIIVSLTSFIHSSYSISLERSEKERKLGVFKEDIKFIGKFQKIEKVPDELFPKNLKTFFPRAEKAQKEVKRIFVDQKSLLEKYPDRMMLGMAYYEFFYMQQLKKHKKDIERFINRYPNKSKNTMQKLYSLNQARKTMRESVGLTFENQPDEAVRVFYTLYKLFHQAKTIEIKLSKEERKKLKLHKEINKYLTSTRKTIEKYQQQRFTEKKFIKEHQKNYKKLERSLKKAEIFKEYELLHSLIIELPDLDLEKDYFLEMELENKKNIKGEKITLEVFSLNLDKVYKFDFENTNQTIRLKLKNKENVNKILLIDLKLKGMLSEFDQMISPDERKIGLKLKSIELVN